MVSRQIITGVLFITVLFAQTDKRKEHPKLPPKKFDKSFILNPIKNQSQFQEQLGNDEIVHIPGYIYRNSYTQNNRSIPDTLAYDLEWGAYFYMLPGDVMMTVFQMPADGTIKGVNVPVYRWGTGELLTVSLHEVSYPYGSDDEMYDYSAVNSSGWLAGYDDNNDGFMELEGTTWNDSSGVCTGSFMVTNAQDPLGWEQGSGPVGTPTMGLLWPDGFTAATMDTLNNPGIEDGGGDNWLTFEDYGSDVEITAGSWVGVAVRYSGSGGDGSDPGIGFEYASDYPLNNHYSLKFYADTCGGTGGENGWYIRSYVFNFQLAVELGGGPHLRFFNIDRLYSTFSTEDRTVTANIVQYNSSGGDAGVVSSTIHYQLDSLTAPVMSEPMSLVEGDSMNGIWSGEIPGQNHGTTIFWTLSAEDVFGYNWFSQMGSYFIFEPTEGNDLIFNNQDPFYGNLIYSSWLYYYWGGEGFDIWDVNYEGFSSELLDHYSTVIELTGNGGPIEAYDDIIEEWWAGDKTYIVTGSEFLYYRDTWIDWPFEDAIVHDILGIYDADYFINWSHNGSSSGISRLLPDSTGVTENLYNFLSDSLFLNYDPVYYTQNYNRLSGIDIVDGYIVDMWAYSGVLDSNGNVHEDAEIYNVMVHGQAGNGGKSAFLAFDPIALNTSPSYHWVGASSYWNMSHPNCPPNANPLVSVYEELQSIVSIENESELPKTFLLKDNYPNPFNPITHIHYELHKNTAVKINIYDVLGREVKTLLDAQQTPGEKTIQWNGTNDLGQPVSAGVYIYKVEAGDFVQTRKMVFLK